VLEKPSYKLNFKNDLSSISVMMKLLGPKIKTFDLCIF
jgi:hypothetical protein